MNIKELAEQANGEHTHPGGVDWYWDELQRFAELVAAHTLMNIDPSKFIGGYQEGFEAGVAKEREECAALCFSIWNTWLDTPEEDRHKVLYDAEDCADAIRARSKA